MTVTSGQGVQTGPGSVQNNVFVTQMLAPEPAPDQVVVGNIPQEPVAFQFRGDLMSRLREAGAGVSMVSTVTGMRGVGKTQLAAAYARACASARYRLVAWVNAETMPETLSGLAVIADRLRLTSGADLNEVATLVRNHLEAQGDRCLVVFDNATDLGALRLYVPASGGCQVVVTTTVTGSAALGRQTSIPVDVYTPAESLAFLAERTGITGGPAGLAVGAPVTPSAAEGAAAVAEQLGHLPLALAQAAAIIAAQRLTYEVYLSRLRRLPLSKYLTPEGEETYPRGAAEAILLSLDAVTTADSTRLCGALMDLIALLSPSGVSRMLLYGMLGSPADVVDAALARLAGRSLLSFAADGRTVSAHRLVTRVLRERQSHEGTLLATAASASAVLTIARDSLGEAWQDRAAVRVWIEHVIALAANVRPVLQGQDGDLTESMLALRGWALRYLNDLGDSSAWAIEIGEALLTDCQQALGASHPDTLTSRNDLAAAYRAAGRADEAIPLYETVLANHEQALGPSHPDTLRLRGDLASAYWTAGRAEDALTLYEATLADFERVLGASHPDTLDSRANLAYAYRVVGRVEEAIELFEATLAEFERVVGASHPHTLTTRNDLAGAYRVAGRVDESIALFEAVLADRDRVLGDSHPDTLMTRNDLAGAYRVAGRVQEAIPLLEAALAGLEQIQGVEHPDTAVVRGNLENARTEARDGND